MKYEIPFLAILGALSIATAGCSSGPAALTPPDLDPEAAAAEAIELYDKDGDGLLSLSELEACPGILVSLGIYDKNGDKMVSAEEISQRLQKYVDSKIAIGRLVVSVRLDRRPLEGAMVRFVPEPYLGDEIKMATGETNSGGTAAMRVAEEELPESQKGIAGVHNGTYRVEITHPKISIPPRYNTETTLGFEPTAASIRATFELKSR